MIKVWYKQPRNIGKALWIHNKLENFQWLVDGPIEVVRLRDPNYVILVNEEGMLRGDMLLNMIVGQNFLFGPLVIVGLKYGEDGDEFCSCDLDAAQVRRLILSEGGPISRG